jgi:hypothetical protein
MMAGRDQRESRASFVLHVWQHRQRSTRADVMAATGTDVLIAAPAIVKYVIADLAEGAVIFDTLLSVLVDAV